MKAFLKTVLVLLTPFLFFLSCKRSDNKIENGDQFIRLNWYKSHKGETKENAETGLIWAMSFLGAKWPKESYNSALIWIDSTCIHLDLKNAGFSQKALEAFSPLILKLKQSDEYKKRGGIDIGRFIMLTLNASNHYYKISGAANRLNEYTQPYTYSPNKAAIKESAISYGQRIMLLPEGNNPFIWSFLSKEGSGDIEQNTFLQKESEVFDIMENGQLRFNMFDEKGDRLLAANALFSSAGKPAKCIWCHEINIQFPFFANSSVHGYMPLDSLKLRIPQLQLQLENARKTLNSVVDFNKKQDHVYTEILYISFCEPSAYRLAQEWQTTEEIVLTQLSKFETHTYPEFPILGSLYHRKQADQFAPYRSVTTPDLAREAGGYEPNLIP